MQDFLASASLYLLSSESETSYLFARGPLMNSRTCLYTAAIVTLPIMMRVLYSDETPLSY